MTEQTTAATSRLHPLEADVMLSDGSVVRVTGLFAVRYRENPEAVRKFIEDEQEQRRKRSTGKSP